MTNCHHFFATPGFICSHVQVRLLTTLWTLTLIRSPFRTYKVHIFRNCTRILEHDFLDSDNVATVKRYIAKETGIPYNQLLLSQRFVVLNDTEPVPRSRVYGKPAKVHLSTEIWLFGFDRGSPTNPVHKKPGQKQVWLINLKGKARALRIHDTDQIIDVKNHINLLEMIPISEQSLNYMAKPLQDSRTVAYYGITSGGYLWLCAFLALFEEDVVSTHYIPLTAHRLPGG